MALRPDAEMTFTSYEVTDVGIVFRFTCADPGPGLDSEYTVLLTDAELNATSTTAQLRTALSVKLSRKLRATGIASRLDGLLGQSITV